MMARIPRSARGGAGRHLVAARVGLAVVAGALLLGLPAGATAQLGLESLFSRATDLGFFAGGGWHVSSQLTGQPDTRVGFEIAFEAARIPRTCHVKRYRAGSEVPSDRGGRGYCAKVPAATDPSVRVDSLSATWIRETWTPTRTSHTLTELDVGRRDSVRKLTPATKSDSLDVLVEAALGFAYAGGFRSASSALDIRGYVRELPSVSLYATEHFSDRRHPRFPRFYLGLRSGLIGLQSVQAVDSSNAYASGSAQAFQGGGVLGAVVGVAGGVSAFVEGGYLLRRFSSIEWKPTSGNSLPRGLPRSLDLSGLTWSAGVQVGIPK